MKKILSFILLLLIAFQSIAFASPVCKSRREVIEKLGIIDDIVMEKEYLTRSDCAKAIYSIFFKEDINELPQLPTYKNISEVYHDMPKEREDYLYFSYLAVGCLPRCGYVYLPIIQGDERGMRPDDLITWPEFVTLCIRAIDWDVFIYLQNVDNYPDVTINYPEDYFNMAERIGFNSFKKEGYVAPDEACNFLYDIIQAPTISPSGFALPENLVYVQGNNNFSVYNACKILRTYVENEQQEIKLKSEYSIEDDTSFVGNNVLILYHSEYKNGEFQRNITDVVTFNDVFEFKGDENGLPKELDSPGIIFIPEQDRKLRQEDSLPR